jgi:hypothetical protein
VNHPLVRVTASNDAQMARGRAPREARENLPANLRITLPYRGTCSMICSADSRLRHSEIYYLSGRGHVLLAGQAGAP